MHISTKKMNICIIGSGNISMNIGLALKRSSFNINRICSRNELTGKKLAKKLNSNFSKEIIIPKKTDLVILGVPDDQIKKISKKIKCKAIIHTAGNRNIDILKNCSKNYGVVWPIQTFTKEKVNFKDIPICIEANSKKFEILLKKIFLNLSKNIIEMNTKNRKIIHLSAVFSCNFINHLFYISKNILSDDKIDFSLLKPIIFETTNKAFKYNIEENQTGPAKRKDLKTIEKHLGILSKTKKKKYIDIYKSITDSIISTYENKL